MLPVSKSLMIQCDEYHVRFDWKYLKNGIHPDQQEKI